MAAIPLGKTAFAMCAGVATVCAGTIGVNALENSADAPQFGRSYLGENRFDQTTFMGRYKQMFLACDPLLLLRSDASFRECAAELIAVKKEYEKNPDLQKPPEENERLWRMKRAVDSAMPNPESGEIIPPPFRMSGYVPFNGPLSVAMVATSSTGGLLFWAWCNQSQNALINYYNRNADSEMSNETLAKSYATAVTAALTVGFVLATAIKKRYSPEQANKLLKFVAFPSSMLASCLNCYIVRSPEIDTGVPLLHPQSLSPVCPPGELSKVAASKGVMETVASRAILQVPVYLVPPLLTATAFSPLLIANPAVAVPLTTYLILVCFGFGLPFAIAVFPQFGEISAAEVEEQFRGVKDSTGNTMEKFKYNKGL